MVQYYNLVRLGMEGYEKILNYLFQLKHNLLKRFDDLEIDGMKIFDIIDGRHSIPAVVLSLTHEAMEMGLDLSKVALEMKKV